VSVDFSFTYNPSDRTMALGSTQPLKEMSARSISWGLRRPVRKADNLPPSCAVVTKSGNLNFLEPSGSFQACNGTALPFYHIRSAVFTCPTSFFFSISLSIAQWLRCCATNRKVAGSIPAGVIGIFHSHNPSNRTMALGSTQPLKEMSARSISWGLRRPVRKDDNLPPSCAVVT